MSQLEELLRRKDLRSADRAVARSWLRKLQGGQPLNYIETQSMWACLSRYGLKPIDTPYRGSDA